MNKKVAAGRNKRETRQEYVNCGMRYYRNFLLVLFAPCLYLNLNESSSLVEGETTYYGYRIYHPNKGYVKVL